MATTKIKTATKVVKKPIAPPVGVVQPPAPVGTMPVNPYDDALKKYYAGGTMTPNELAMLGFPATPATQPTTSPTPTTLPAVNVPVGTSANANQILDYQNAIANADEAFGKAGIVNNLQVRQATAAGDLATRAAERNIYNAQQGALNQLAQRGISGSPGLKVAAERAAIVAPTATKLQAINTMKENVSAANLLLAEEAAKRQKAINDANAMLTKVTNLSNQIGGKP